MVNMWFKKQKKNILVHYINVGGVNPKDVPAFMDKIKEQLPDIPDGCYRYFIPIINEPTRIEVIYLQ